MPEKTITQIICDECGVEKSEHEYHIIPYDIVAHFPDSKEEMLLVSEDCRFCSAKCLTDYVLKKEDKIKMRHVLANQE